MALAGVGCGPSRETGLVSVTILCPSCEERPSRGCTQAGEQTLTTESLGKGRKGPGCGQDVAAGTCWGRPNLRRRVSVPRETQARQLGSPGRKGREKTSGNCRHGHFVQTLGRLHRSGSAVVYSFGGKWLLCSLQLGHWGDTAAALLGAASFLPIMRGRKTEATRDLL